MKKNIHPNYFPNSVFTCACGEKYTIGSTKEVNTTDMCSACHPFYTGNERTLDTAGRVEKFKARQSAATKVLSKKSATK